jgi:hypothetical protein
LHDGLADKAIQVMDAGGLLAGFGLAIIVALLIWTLTSQPPKGPWGDD